jgi:hypothetical protein
VLPHPGEIDIDRARPHPEGRRLSRIMSTLGGPDQSAQGQAAGADRFATLRAGSNPGGIDQHDPHSEGGDLHRRLERPGPGADDTNVGSDPLRHAPAPIRVAVRVAF